MSSSANKPLKHFVEEDEYRLLDEEIQRNYSYVGFAHGYLLDEGPRETKLLLLILAGLLILLCSLGAYGAWTANDALELVAIGAGLPTFFGLMFQVAIYFMRSDKQAEDP